MRQRTGSFWLLLFCVWFATIIFLALWLETSTPSTSESSALALDKIQHVAAFGLLALLGGKTLEYWLPVTRAWLLTFVLVVLLGGMVEVAQAWLTTSRNGDWQDLLADAVGAGVVCAVALLLHSFGKR